MELRPLYTLTWTMIFIAVVWMCIDVYWMVMGQGNAKH